MNTSHEPSVWSWRTNGWLPLMTLHMCSHWTIPSKCWTYMKGPSQSTVVCTLYNKKLYMSKIMLFSPPSIPLPLPLLTLSLLPSPSPIPFSSLPVFSHALSYPSVFTLHPFLTPSPSSPSPLPHFLFSLALLPFSLFYYLSLLRFSLLPPPPFPHFSNSCIQVPLQCASNHWGWDGGWEDSLAGDAIQTVEPITVVGVEEATWSSAGLH